MNVQAWAAIIKKNNKSHITKIKRDIDCPFIGSCRVVMLYVLNMMCRHGIKVLVSISSVTTGGLYY